MNPNYQVYIANAFTEKAFKGTPVGIVFPQEELPEEMMKKIAAELKQPKTVFVYQADREIFKMRYFSPEREIDLCGNATIAAFWMLVKLGYLDDSHQSGKEIILFTKNDKLKVELKIDRHKLHSVHMTQPRGTIIGQPKSMKKLMSALGLHPKDIGYIEPVIASTGIPTLLLNLKQKALVQQVDPDFEALRALSEEENFDVINLYHVSKTQTDLYQRSFMPKYGISSEPATATSAAALHYALDTLGVTHASKLTIYQGNEQGRPSKILSHLANIKDESRIIISGRATLVIEGVMNL